MSRGVKQFGLGVIGGVIGYFAGGPEGAMFGFEIGYGVGGATLPLPNAYGPRLGDAAAQRFTYGQGIPRVHGIGPKIACYPLWADEAQQVQEFDTSTGGGKGMPPQNVYKNHYIRDFAVGICQRTMDDGVNRPISGVRRIWFDAVLVYEMGQDVGWGQIIDQQQPFDGSWFHNITNSKTWSALRIYPGTESQDPDPLIEAHVGVGRTPGYRGYAYMVFEGCDLTKWGGRIPTVHVEVVENGSVDAAGIQEDHMAGTTFANAHAMVNEAGVLTLVDRDVAAGGSGKAQKLDVDGNKLGEPFDYDYPARPPGHDADPFDYYGKHTTGGVWRNGGTVWVGSVNATVTCAALALSSDGQYCAYITHDDGNFQLRVIQSDLSPLAAIGVAGQSVVDQFKYCMGYEPGYLVGVGGSAAAPTVVLYSLDHQAAQMTQLGSWQCASLATARISGAMAIYGGIAYIADVQSDASTRWIVASRNAAIVPSTVQLSDAITAICAERGVDASQLDLTALTQTLIGYVRVNPGSGVSDLRPLMQAYFLDCVESGGKLRFQSRNGQTSVKTITADELGAYDAGSGSPPPDYEVQGTRAGEYDLPRQVRVTYYRSVAEYDPGVADSRRLDGGKQGVADIQLPLVMDDAAAQRVAETHMDAAIAERTGRMWSVGPVHLDLEPGDQVTIQATAATYTVRIAHWSLALPALLELRGVDADAAAYNEGAGGGSVPGTDPAPGPAGPTLLVPIDAALVQDSDDDPGFYAALSDYYAGWSEGGAYRSTDGGGTFSLIGSATAPAPVGDTIGTLAAGPTTIIDEGSVLNVNFVTPDVALESIDDPTLLNGGNVAFVGKDGRWECLQFADATQNSDGSWTLTRLLRGRRGTEWAVGLHQAADAVVILSGGAGMGRYNFGTADIGLARIYRGVTAGDDVSGATDVPFTNTAEGLKPYSPCHLKMSASADGSLVLSWVRRTRTGGEWRDYVDAALGETTEAYEVDIVKDGSVVRTLSGLTSPTATYNAADQTTDFGSLPNSLTWRVYQLSEAVGRGHAGEATLNRQPGNLNFMSLMHFDTVSATPPWTDEVGNAWTVKTGTPDTQSGVRKFGAGAAYFGGGGSIGATLPAIGDEDFTIQLWIQPDSPYGDNTGRIFQLGTTGDGIGLSIVRDGTSYPVNVLCRVGTTLQTVALSTTGMDDSKMHHLELGRKGSDYYLFIDGALADHRTVSSYHAITATDAYIGADSWGAEHIKAYMDEFAIVLGRCLHTDDFTPPAVPFTF